MEIIDEIVKFYNGKIEENKDNFVNSCVSVFGDNSKNIFKEKVHTLMPIYVITREGIEKTLENLSMHSLDEKVINYFQSFLEDKNRSYLGHYGYLSSSTLDLLNKSNRNYVISSYDVTKSLAFHYEQDIYTGTLSKDLIYINHLLIYTGIKNENGRYKISTGNVDDEEILTTFSDIINQLSVLILVDLHYKNIFVLDNKSLIPSIYDYINALSPCFSAFYRAFKHLAYLFVTDFEKFLNVVGKSEFLEFSVLYNNMEIDMINEVIDKMLKNTNYNMLATPTVDFNLSLIERTIKKYKKNLGN